MPQEYGAMALQIAMLVGVAVVFYLVLIRPQQKKDKAVKKMLAELKVGDRVTTIGGMHGRVTSIKDDIITVEIGADKVKLVFARWGIRSVDETQGENDLI